MQFEQKLQDPQACEDHMIASSYQVWIVNDCYMFAYVSWNPGSRFLIAAIQWAFYDAIGYWVLVTLCMALALEMGDTSSDST